MLFAAAVFAAAPQFKNRKADSVLESVGQNAYSHVEYKQLKGKETTVCENS